MAKQLHPRGEWSSTPKPDTLREELIGRRVDSGAAIGGTPEAELAEDIEVDVSAAHNKSLLDR